MPPVNKKLDVSVKVSVNKRFITENIVKIILFRKTIARSEENGKVMYDVLLNEANGYILKLSEGTIKYVGPLSTPVAQEIVVDTNVVEAEDLLEDAVDKDEEEGSIDLTSSRGWTAGEVYMDSRLSDSAEGFTSLNSCLIMNNGRYVSSLDYFLFFLPSCKKSGPLERYYLS
ncbi:hypothetical protein BCV72DRAFT_243690 [Rhizopus microsporus var. microsporus]|uniref:Uncharacterized protein n=2 Tax=Rhizopus microsporus TaxID=58291 RepID=A0A2G4SWC8_RHIZD|nr:uncharacterized protein RHIMIDRAFT_251134 [Rhizopus microsporus ATCC 52813]ORE04348.1 hypothetical protein BCV72DRAFT_243690 [Rhizopus microsporus var. microsporus]PHZ13042.1 hypothetical protein RHIMIDRAFT_251134 [Rhizopus microsporus ATCC 52813]